MPRCTITIDGGFGGRQVEISVNGHTDIEALSRAISTALAAYGSDIRRAVDEVRTTLEAARKAMGDA